MPNPYYNRVTDFVPDTHVRSSDHDAELNAIVEGFDKLGDPTALGDGSILWGTDSGTPNNYAWSNGSEDDTLSPGRLITFAPLNTNTDVSVVSYNGGSNYPVRRNNGTPLSAGDLIAGVPVMLIWDDDVGRWCIIGSTAAQISSVSRPAVSVSDDTSHTVTATDENRMTKYTSSSAVTVTVPNDSTENLPIGFITHVQQNGTGALSVAGDVGVTMEYAYSLTARARYSSLSMMKTAANRWSIVGDVG